MTTATALDLLQVPADVALPVRLPVGRRHLADMIRDCGFTRGAEIGVWEGGFAEKLLTPNPGVELLCVDPWAIQADYREVKNDHARMAAAFETARTRLARFNCKFMKMTSAQAAPMVADGSLDFVYIDGNHLYDHVLHDIRLWVPKVRSGGIVAGHDYTVSKKTKTFIQVQAAVDLYTREHGISPWFVLTGDKSASWMWVKR